MIPTNDLDIFPEGDPSARWSRSYWKEKLKHADVVDKISKQINGNDFKPAPDKYPQQPSDYFHEGASVNTVIKPRNLQEESLDFFKAQRDISTDILPKQTTATKAPPTPSGQDAIRPRMDLFDMQWHRNEDFARQNSTLTLDIPNKSGTITDQQNMFPKGSKASENKITISVNDAFTKTFPHGNSNQPSAAMKPSPKNDVNCPHCHTLFNYNLQNETQMGAVACPSCGKTVTQASFESNKPIVVTADTHKGGDRGDEFAPSKYVGTIQLEEKSGASTDSKSWIGDQFLPPGTQDGKKSQVDSRIPISSNGDAAKAWDGTQFTDLDFQAGLGNTKKPLLDFGNLLQAAIEAGKLKLIPNPK
jgi:hypothetical protein